MTTEVDYITADIIDASLKVHSGLGPGLLESVYEVILARELVRRGHKVLCQLAISFDFDGMHFDDGFKVDMLVDDLVVVELKSVTAIAPIHSKQVLTYLRLMNLKVGLLINFGGETLKEGLRRIVNRYLASDEAPRRLPTRRHLDSP